MSAIARPLATTLAVGAAVTLVLGLLGLTAPSAEAAARPTGTVTVDDLNVRRAPTTHAASVTTVDRGFTFDVRCQVPGPAVGGNPTWLAVGPDVGKWVSATYVDTRGTIPLCAEGETVRGTTTGDPVLNSFDGPSIQDDSQSEYQPGSPVRLRCEVTNRARSGSTTWYLTGGGEWLAGDYVQLRRGADLPIC